MSLGVPLDPLEETPPELPEPVEPAPEPPLEPPPFEPLLPPPPELPPEPLVVPPPELPPELPPDELLVLPKLASSFEPLDPLTEPSPPANGSHVVKLKEMLVEPPSSVMPGPAPPPPPMQTPPSPHALPMSLGAQYSAPVKTQAPHARPIPVPVVPPELLVDDPELPLPPPASSTGGGAQPAGSSQHHAGTQVPPEQALPISATGHSAIPAGVCAAAIWATVKASEPTTPKTKGRFMKSVLLFPPGADSAQPAPSEKSRAEGAVARSRGAPSRSATARIGTPGEGPAKFTFHAIGVVRSPFAERAAAPRQARVATGVDARIELFAGHGYEDALQDLSAWQYVWVVFVFHKNVEEQRGWKPKVLPPRATEKHGVFATRSPHRPNPIGLSAVRLVRVEGLVVHVREVDLLDGTPVLDLKPYVPYADALPDAGSGWLGAGDPRAVWTVAFSHRALEQLAWLHTRGVDLRAAIEAALALGPQPHAYRRIRKRGDGMRLALKDWRVDFDVRERSIRVRSLESGYRPKQLADDPGLALHRAFAATFAAGR
jgi:tRNA-Thr(GGU) m(6)t(6)A37 methyltransferase TsaA